MKTLIALFVAVLLAPAMSAQIIIASSGDAVGTTPIYGSTYFSGVQLDVGDILVITHGNNKNANSTNTITASFAGTTGGANTFTALAAPSTGTTSGAWTFYSVITQATTADIILDTSSTTKTLAHVSSFYVVRPSAGYELAVGGTATAVATNTAQSTTGTLSFSLNAGYADAIGFASLALNTGTATTTPSGWTRDQNGVNKRGTFFTGTLTSGAYSNSPISGTNFSTTWTTDVTTDLALSGIVITSTLTGTQAIPEPSTWLLLSCGMLLVGWRIRGRTGARRLGVDDLSGLARHTFGRGSST